MTTDNHRSVTLDRTATGTYVARNARGGEIRLGMGTDDSFTPVELLLAAVGGCSSVDVDVVTSRRAEADRFHVVVGADKVSGANGNILENISLRFEITFPEGEAGDAARSVLPRAAQTSHDRTCTVSRTVETGVPVAYELAD
jgi:putative redox protein